ncbi:hypothetical protein P4O66_018735 [Electrophorus voltai]|uniref:Uncharacterized protein n=1 Tax=Electrophorus voltai TaxID=2609070 RepID=A0AAD9DK10_9TELE|nr:hypothetical protein P4O66_018735 [Electrophorus voltai]
MCVYSHTRPRPQKRPSDGWALGLAREWPSVAPVIPTCPLTDLSTHFLKAACDSGVLRTGDPLNAPALLTMELLMFLQHGERERERERERDEMRREIRNEGMRSVHDGGLLTGNSVFEEGGEQTRLANEQQLHPPGSTQNSTTCAPHWLALRTLGQAWGWRPHPPHVNGWIYDVTKLRREFPAVPRGDERERREALKNARRDELQELESTFRKRLEVVEEQRSKFCAAISALEQQVHEREEERRSGHAERQHKVLELQQFREEIASLQEENALLQETVRRECEERAELTATLSEARDQLMKLQRSATDPRGPQGPAQPSLPVLAPGHGHPPGRDTPAGRRIPASWQGASQPTPALPRLDKQRTRKQRGRRNPVLSQPMTQPPGPTGSALARPGSKAAHQAGLRVGAEAT